MAFRLTFRELHDDVQLHDFMLFIQGVDVAPWTTGSLSWTYAGAEGQNTLTVTLDNAFDRFVLTKANLKGSWRAGSDAEFSEQAKRSIYNLKKSKNLLDTLTNQLRWALHPNRMIFSKYDPVRLFIRDPYSESENYWIPAFTGYVVSPTGDDDYLTGTQNIQLSCADIREPMQRMRVQVNAPKGIGTHELEPIFNNAGMFSDLLEQMAIGTKELKHRLSELKFEEMMSLLITGVVGGDVALRSNTFVGVGDFTQGDYFFMEPRTDDKGAEKFYVWRTREDIGVARPDSSLEEWNRLILFGADMNYLSKARCIEIGKGTTTDGEHRPDAQRLHMLLPRDGTPWTSLVNVQLPEIVGSREWINRADFIRQIVEMVGYQWFVTASGDIIFEFGQMDFLPQFYGAFKNVYEYDYHLISDNFGDEVGNPPAALVAVGGYDFQLAGGAGDTNEALLPRAWVESNMIASKYGVTVETVTFPYTTDVDLLCLLAAVAYAKRLSEANTISFQSVYRPYLFPNRPQLIKPRERMATIETVSHTLNILGEPSTQVEVKYVRFKGADGVYRLICGTPDAPITYRNFAGTFVAAPPGVGQPSDITGVGELTPATFREMADTAASAVEGVLQSVYEEASSGFGWYDTGGYDEPDVPGAEELTAIDVDRTLRESDLQNSSIVLRGTEPYETGYVPIQESDFFPDNDQQVTTPYDYQQLTTEQVIANMNAAKGKAVAEAINQYVESVSRKNATPTSKSAQAPDTGTGVQPQRSNAIMSDGIRSRCHYFEGDKNAQEWTGVLPQTVGYGSVPYGEQEAGCPLTLAGTVYAGGRYNYVRTNKKTGKSTTHKGVDLWVDPRVDPTNLGTGSTIVSMTSGKVVFARSFEQFVENGGNPIVSGTVERGSAKNRRTFDAARETEDGQVVYPFNKTKAAKNGSAGVYVVVRDENGKDWRYMHLAALAPGISKGTQVSEGTPLGYLGGTDVLNDSPHLHLDVKTDDGTYIDPTPYLSNCAKLKWY